MRHYHLKWIYRFSAIALLAGFVVMAISWFDTNYEWGLMRYSVPLIFAGLLPNLVINLWLSFKQGGNLQSPSCPEGLPVDPSGVWIDDDLRIEVGMRMLALSEGRWHRAVVVGVNSEDRISVHCIGWDAFWDDVIPRRKLQVDQSVSSEEGPSGRGNSDTGIREGP
jgi:hypothetical protein